MSCENKNAHYYLRPICSASPSKFIIAYVRLVSTLREHLLQISNTDRFSVRTTSKVNGIEYCTRDTRSTKVSGSVQDTVRELAIDNTPTQYYLEESFPTSEEAQTYEAPALSFLNLESNIDFTNPN